MRYLSTLLLLISITASANVYHEVSISSGAGFGLDSAQLSTQTNRLGLVLDYDQSLWSMKFDGYWEYDAVYDWRSQYSDAADREYRTRFWVEEAYLGIRGQYLDVFLGYQKVVWGQADDLRIVDIVNPLDLKNFVLFDIDEYRISLPMLRLEASMGQWSLQGLAILSTKPNQLPPIGSEFALQPEGIERDVLPKDPEYGFRAQTFWLDTDMAVYAFRGYHDNPVITFQDATPELTYRRETLWGGSLSRPIGDVVVRAELAHTTNRGFNTVSGGFIKRDVDQWMLGVDYLYQNWLITMQVTDSQIMDWSSMLIANENEPMYTLSADGRLLSDTLNLRFSVTHADYNGGGQLYQMKLAYSPNRHWEWRTHIDILSGDNENFLGQFKDRDRLWIALTYTF